MCDVQGPNLYVDEAQALVDSMRFWTRFDSYQYGRLYTRLIAKLNFYVNHGHEIGHEPSHITTQVDHCHTLHAFVYSRANGDIQADIVAVVFDDDGAPLDPDPKGTKTSRATYIFRLSRNRRSGHFVKMSGRDVLRTRWRRNRGSARNLNRQTTRIYQSRMDLPHGYPIFYFDKEHHGPAKKNAITSRDTTTNSQEENPPLIIGVGTRLDLHPPIEQQDENCEAREINRLLFTDQRVGIRLTSDPGDLVVESYEYAEMQAVSWRHRLSQTNNADMQLRNNPPDRPRQ